MTPKQPLPPPPLYPRGGEPIRPTTDFRAPQRVAPDLIEPRPKETEKFNYDLVRGYTMPGTAPESSRPVAPDMTEPMINPERRRPRPSPVTSRAPELKDYTGMSIEFPYMRKSNRPDESMDLSPPDTDFSPHTNPIAPPDYKNLEMSKMLQDSQMRHAEEEPQEPNFAGIPGTRSPMKKGGRVQTYTNKSGGINLGSGRVSTASKNSKSPKW